MFFASGRQKPDSDMLSLLPERENESSGGSDPQDCIVIEGSSAIPKQNEDEERFLNRSNNDLL
jgi:hypothetical protein